ncbi:DUF1758 domain-containing protein [Trichonephila clavipes]|nr:DUF1758 domain-containing protein [Trichonephila clavipes]
MPISNDSYEEAWQKLLDGYDNKKQIVQSLIKTFLDQKPISEANCFNLRKLLDTSDECLRGLNALGEQASSKDCWLIYLLLQKIDPESRRLWAIKSSEEEFPIMKAFLDFLNGNETSQGEGANAGTRNEASEFKGQAGESQIYSGASVNSELNLSFLPTANVKIFYNNNSNESIICRALLDSGSERCFISERVANILGLKRKSSKKFLFAGVTAGQTKGCVDLVIGSQSSNERLEVNAFILNKVTSQIPSEFLDVKDLDYLKSIPLSDEEFMSPKECDIILGSDCFFDILCSGKIVDSKNEPIAQRTMFGWVVAGKLNVKNKEPHELYSHFLSTENELNTDSLLQRFWETKELSVKKQFLSDEEQFCENHFESNFKYKDEGRFVVKLPIYGHTSRLGNTKGIAISRLLAMERRFQVDKDFERQYKNFMIEYESLGHMIPVENNMKSMDSKIYFLHHHAVRKGDSVSTKLCVVFDGTCKPSNGNSLNSILGIGKMLPLHDFLVKFRLNEIAFSADIQQMYRQILIDQEDQNFQRIVWRESKDSPIREYKLCTVTYGTASAPYLATRCLFQTGLDLERDGPAVSSLIKESFYIDDLMAGAPSSEEAISLIKTLSSILEARGFHLRKWRSSSSEVLSRISSNWVGDSSNLEIHPDECSKALELTWNPMKDIFIFNLKVNFPDNITKRFFLSQSAKLFDPLGILTPRTVSIKIFYQQLWLLKLDWDSPLPEALATKWKTFQKQFEQVCSLHIPRWIHTASQQITLHGFCDASELAYASVIYAVQPQADGNTKVTLLVAKSRVAPLKSVSIPRLELNGALLLARLYATCKNILKEYDVHLCMDGFQD